jgi:hypothetical protein
LRLAASLRAPGAALDPAGLVSILQGGTITEGWDVISAICAAGANALFQATFASRFVGNDTPKPITTKLTVGFMTEIEFIDVVLGPPLIQCSPAIDPQKAMLTVPLIGGVANEMLAGAGARATVVSCQIISELQGYAITGLVPLRSVQGDDVNHRHIVLDIVNGSDFRAVLNVPAAARSTVGEYLQTVLQQPNGYQYSIGTLIDNVAGSSLNPLTFRIATQVDASDPDDLGRVLLFIATQYNPGGGVQTSLNVPNIVPAGCSTTLVVSSEVLFAGILQPCIASSLVGSNPRASQPAPGRAYIVTTTAGSFDAGVQSSGGARTGYCSTEDLIIPVGVDQAVKVPLYPITWSASGGQLSATGTPAWSLDWWVMSYTMGYPACNHGTSSLTASVSCSYTASVDPATQMVSFNGSVQSPVRFQPTSGWMEFVSIVGGGFDPDNISGGLADQTKSALAAISSVRLPSVALFASANLLFPLQSPLSLQQVFVPGDLVVFGTVRSAGIRISPAMAVLTPGQQFTFAASESCTWHAGTGSIHDGVYTAPPQISGSLIDWVTATAEDRSLSAAVVLVLPPQLVVSPLFLVTWPGAPSHAKEFSAAGPDASGPIAWSVSDGGGTVSADGTYTPPASVSSPTAAVVTATQGARTGTANLVLLPQLPVIGGVMPPFTQLGAGQHQSFTASLGSNSGTVRWSLLPADGSGTIDQAGHYKAPPGISELKAIAVVASGGGPSEPISVGVVLLTPPGPNGVAARPGVARSPR